MNQGEIWLVQFDPSIGHEIQKIRPALIIQSSRIVSPLITVMPISSQIHKKRHDDIYIQKNVKNRLYCDSILKVQQIASFDKKRFLHFIGKINSKTQAHTEKYLKKHFSIYET